MNINIWFHIFNSILVLAALFVGYNTYRMIEKDWVRIMPMMLVVLHFGLFYISLLLRDFEIYLMSPQTINIWVHIIIAQTLTTILMMYTIYIYEYRNHHKYDLFVKKLEKRCQDLQDQIEKIVRMPLNHDARENEG